MSTTKTVVAKPYFNMAVEEELAREDAERNGQNPNTNSSNGSGSADQTTQNGGQTATSDGEDPTIYKERWVNLKRYHDTSIHEARNKIKELETKLQESSAISITPPTNAAELEKFKQENPDMYRQMEEAFSKGNNNSAVSMDDYMDMQSELIKSRQELALEQIKLAHPDMIDLIADPKFNDWVEAQSRSVQGMIKDNSEDASAFIRALDLYKLDNGITSSVKGTSTEKSNHDASAADAVTTNGASAEIGSTEGRIWTREEIRKLTPHEFEMFEQDIETAWKEGRVRN